MKAMILAAGLGTRMRPLTDDLPKPLLPVAGKPLIFYHLENLARAGVREVLINVSHLAEKIEAGIGDGSRWGMVIQYSRELAPLETAGALVHAAAWLGADPFALINGDVWSDFDLGGWVKRPPLSCSGSRLAHLLLVPNPAHHPEGDFGFATSGVSTEPALLSNERQYTFAGMSVIHPALFAGLAEGKRPLGPLLREAIAHGLISGELHRGLWVDVGTPERLHVAQEMILAGSDKGREEEE